LNSFIALGILDRIKNPVWRVSLCCTIAEVTSMNSVTKHAQSRLEDTRTAADDIVGSGMQTRETASSAELTGRLSLDPHCQPIAAQCSGTLILARLGLLAGVPACTDLTSAPGVQEAGIDVLNQPFYARGNVATAGGCLASSYLAAWMIARTGGATAAAAALHCAAPVGEKDSFVANAVKTITPYLPR